ncbi:haloacid dehalogenase [Sphaerisporangium krabiense]|uniref:HAD superfamily hydrolase (TIGR01509 family) n=1 Tax=Sphaerisporangium krabiense TaxID=763782 RepID=A0A7W8Z2M2_9ACTN|nr:HAD family hydrolase [Sphaerisporangium krabiense]MBB5626307.1 HAD superfamily hydrolase (TIGR01509 family) [Sphaerisporangium krabiense]GII66028.1 haloacid dehalogenase [Sphaerisporangium krabiense]
MRRGVIFDLDGTLVDTTYLHVVAWWEAFRRNRRDVLMLDIHGAIGRADRALLDYLLPKASEEEAQAISDAHAEIYKPRLDDVRPVPGAGELMRTLADRGLTVVVATSAPKDQAERLVKITGAEDAVAVLVHAGDVDKSKPHPEPVRQALDKSGMAAEQAFMIGDSVWDALSARAAGAACMGVRSGGIDTASLLDAGAEAVYKDCRDLLYNLEESPLERLLRS